MTEVECSVTVKYNGVCFLSPAKVKLLREVDRCGSLNLAAKSLQISYQHAWTMINELNQTSTQTVVIKQRGGLSGGGAELSEYGHKILSEYRLIENQFNKLASQINVEINL